MRALRICVYVCVGSTRRSSKILTPDLMGHHLAHVSNTNNTNEEEDQAREEKDFWYTKARSVVISPQDRGDKFNVDGEVTV